MKSTTGTDALSEAGRIYVENRVAVELAQSDATAYFSKLSAFVESGLGATLAPGRMKWKENTQYGGKGKNFHDYVADLVSAGTGKPRQASIRVYVRPDKNALVQVGFWRTADTPAFVSENPGAVKDWRRRIEQDSTLGASPGTEKWTLAEAQVGLDLADPRADAKAVLSLAGQMMTAIESLLLETAAGRL